MHAKKPVDPEIARNFWPGCTPNCPHPEILSVPAPPRTSSTHVEPAAHGRPILAPYKQTAPETRNGPAQPEPSGAVPDVDALQERPVLEPAPVARRVRLDQRDQVPDR